jgi:hypothetical protein
VNFEPLRVNLVPEVFTKPVAPGLGVVEVEVGGAEVVEEEEEEGGAGVVLPAPGRHWEYHSF